MDRKENYFQNTDKLSLTNENPLYTQIADAIRESIRNGKFAVGNKLPSETELCEYYNVSRTTVRQCFKLLEKEGLVIRRRGMGTFISTPKLSKKMENLYSFSKHVREINMIPSSKVIEFGLIFPSSDMQKLFNIQNSERLFQFTRVRYANEEPQLIETTLIPEVFLPSLTPSLLERESLYSMLADQAGIVQYSAQESYEAIFLTKQDTYQLCCEDGICGFLITRKSVTEDGRVYEYTKSRMRGDRVKFVIDLNEQNTTIRRNFESFETN